MCNLALISCDLARPSSFVTGAFPFLFNVWMVSSSSRRSFLVPTRMMGTPGAWWLISGNHLTATFSNDVGEVMA